jgi:hypothetical protein
VAGPWSSKLRQSTSQITQLLSFCFAAAHFVANESTYHLVLYRFVFLLLYPSTKCGRDDVWLARRRGSLDV